MRQELKNILEQAIKKDGKLSQRVIAMMRALAGGNLCSCVKTGIIGLEQLDERMHGTDDMLTENYLLDIISLEFGAVSKDKEYSICTLEGEGLSRILGVHGTGVDRDSLLSSIFLKYGIGDALSSQQVEYEDDAIRDEDNLNDNIEEYESLDVSEDDSNTDDLEEVEEVGEDLSSDDNEEVIKEEKPEPEPVKEEKDPYIEKAKFFYKRYKGQLAELEKVYSVLFSSGYSVKKPTGVLCEAGIVTLSGTIKMDKLTDRSKSNSARAIAKFSSSEDITFKILNDMMVEKLKYIESDARSVVEISNDILQCYSMQGRPLVYFPYKMLEFAYGRKAASGDNQNSKNTYTAQAVANSWNEYYSKEVKNVLERQVGRCIGQLLTRWEAQGISLEEMQDKVDSFVSYFIDCFSLCILVPEYREANNDPLILKIRISDPKNSLGVTNLIPEIIQRVYGGATGTEAFTQGVSFYGETGTVKEYSHEFNRTLSQAMPIFAYKALEILQNQGESLNWNSMVLGQYEDGSILRNGMPLSVASHDGGGGTQVQISLNNCMTHIISAGSRAGKGVMTLAFLANALASNKAIFYIDRKPDMASVLKQFVNGNESASEPPKMFVMNGAAYSEQEDSFHQWDNANNFINKYNVPDYAKKAFGVKGDDLWYSGGLGDFFYMRALRLIVGLAIARGTAGAAFAADPLNGGNDGLVLILDEVSNFQAAYNNLFKNMLKTLPPTFIQLSRTVSKIATSKQLLASEQKEAARVKLQADIITEQDNISKCFTPEGFYTLAVLESMKRDLEYILSVKNAAFDKGSIETTDILVIGQNLDPEPMQAPLVDKVIKEQRYASNTVGIKGSEEFSSVKKNGKVVQASLLEAIVQFQNRDAILGRNDIPYLAQTDKSSPAYGKLDEKARYFAFVPNFNESAKQRLNTTSLANEAVYFKPYLILNDCQPGELDPATGFRKAGEKYTGSLLGFSAKSGISIADLTAEYGNDQEIDEDHPNGTFLHPGIGLGAYLASMGATDLASILSKSSAIADHVVRDYLGYQGSADSNAPLWLQFVTDLRMEWEFGIQDVVEACKNPTILSQNNPNLVEYQSYLDEIAKISDDAAGGSQGMNGFSFTDDDLSADEADMVRDLVTDRMLEQALSDDTYEEYGVEGEIDDFFGDEEDNEEPEEDVLFSNEEVEEIYSDSSLEEIEDEFNDGMGAYEGNYNRNRIGDYTASNVLENEETSAEDLIAKLESMGYSVSKPCGRDARVRQDGSGLETSYEVAPVRESMSFEDISSGQTSVVSNGEEVKVRDFSALSNPNADVSEEIKATSYKQLVKRVTDKLIRDYGGLARISTFKVVGGGLVVNNALYQCTIDKASADLVPYDIRLAINNGQIATLFDYSCLLYMKNLNTVSFDSADHAYSYVAPMLGYTDGISVDKFFHDLKSLSILVIEGETYTRDNYREKIKDNDAFYTPSTAARYANALHSGTRKLNQSVWNATKNVAANRHYPNIIRWIATAGLGAASIVTGAARVSTSVVEEAAKGTSARKNDRGYFEKARGFFGSFSSGVRDAFNGSND